MTIGELEIIVSNHEMQRLELKESFGAECIESACAFANAGGGFIVIGVDNKGNPSQRQLRFEGLRDYENKIATATEPSVAVDAEKVDFRGREVVVLKVAENPLKPVAVKGRCFVRKGSVNHQMTPAEIAEAHVKSTGSSMDSVFVPGATRVDLDMATIRRYMRKAVAENRRNYAEDEDPWHTLLKLGWVKSESEITRAAYLLFAKDPQLRFSQAVIHAGAFKADGAVIIDSHDSVGNIQDQVEDALAFIQRNIRCAIVVSGKAEHDRYWEYPVEGLREALANAVCHRDYGQPNDIQVKVFEDRVVITNPGQLPFDMSLEELEDPDHASRPRNKLIAQAFYDMHIIEHYGSGIRRIKDDCDKNGSPYPILKSGNMEFRITFHARTKESIAKLGINPVKLGFAFDTEKSTENSRENTEKSTENSGKNTEKSTENSGKNTEKSTENSGENTGGGPNKSGKPKRLTETEARIVSILGKQNNATQGYIATQLGVTRTYVTKIMGNLQTQGVIRRVGPDKGGHWEVIGGEP